MSSWQSESSTMEQDDLIRKLAKEVLRRNLGSRDLHAAYEFAGVSRPPRLMPPNLTGLQADRLIKWLNHLKAEAGKPPVEDNTPDPCVYCAFGCELCEPEDAA